MMNVTSALVGPGTSTMASSGMAAPAAKASPAATATPSGAVSDAGVMPCSASAEDSPPRFRHSYATAPLQAAVNIEILADRPGHSTSAVTRAIYLHPVEELDREAASMVSRLILGGGVKPAVEDPGG